MFGFYSCMNDQNLNASKDIKPQYDDKNAVNDDTDFVADDIPEENDQNTYGM